MSRDALIWVKAVDMKEPLDPEKRKKGRPRGRPF